MINTAKFIVYPIGFFCNSASESVQTWRCATLHLFDQTNLLKGYSLAPTKYALTSLNHASVENFGSWCEEAFKFFANILQIKIVVKSKI